MARATSQVFPQTISTWIGLRMGEGTQGRDELNRHVMSVYAFPLRVYFLGTRDRWLGEPDDVVQGFFADRLAKPDFFNDWQSSGHRLRHWLINAFCFYLKELRRARQRDARNVGEPDEPVTFDGDPTRAVNQAFVVSVVREALRKAGEQCAAQNLTPHWNIFLAHFYQSRPYEDIGKEVGVTASRAVVMARTASRKFQAALHEILASDASTEGGDIDSEILALIQGAKP